MNWQDVCDDPHLQDLPYKVELNGLGQIVMSPASNEHGRFQTLIAAKLLTSMEGGEVITETSIDTSDGTKVADVSWGSETFYSKNGLVTPLPLAPEICVEIVSPGNTTAEMASKTALYLAQGAKEVWLCDQDGRLTFHTSGGQVDSSVVAKGFPNAI